MEKKRFSGNFFIIAAILIIAMAFFSSNSFNEKSGSVVVVEDYYGEGVFFNEELEEQLVSPQQEPRETQETQEPGQGQNQQPTERRIGELKDCEDRKINPAGNGDTCYFSGAGKVCKTMMNTQSGETKEYCCDWVAGQSGTQECKCEKEYKNPCSTARDCLKCMIYAEAGDTRVDDACEKYVGCTIYNRVSSGNYPNDFCSVVSEDDGKQFNPYSCTCDSNTNQKYCECCSGNIQPGTPAATEVAEADAEAGRIISQANYCQNFRATGFFTGPGRIPAGCTRVQAPGCVKGAFTFYSC